MKLKNGMVIADAGYTGTQLIKNRHQNPLENDADGLDRKLFSIVGKGLLGAVCYRDRKSPIYPSFATDASVFVQPLKTVLKYCRKNSSVVIWVSWYKKFGIAD